MGKWATSVESAKGLYEHMLLLGIVSEDSEEMEELHEKTRRLMEKPDQRDLLVRYLNWGAKEISSVPEKSTDPDTLRGQHIFNLGVYRYDKISYMYRGYDKMKNLLKDDFDFSRVENKLENRTKKVMDSCIYAKDIDLGLYARDKQASPSGMMDYIDKQDGLMQQTLIGRKNKKFHIDEDYYQKRGELIQASYDKMRLMRDELKGTKKKFFSDSKLFTNMMTNLDDFLDAVQKGKGNSGFFAEETVQKYNELMNSCNKYVSSRSGSKITESGKTRLEDAKIIQELLLHSTPQRIDSKAVAERDALREDRNKGKAYVDVKTGESGTENQEERLHVEYLGRKDYIDYEKMLVEIHQGSELLQQDFMNEYHKLSKLNQREAKKIYDFSMQALTEAHRVPENPIPFDDLINPDPERGKKRTFELEQTKGTEKEKISLDTLQKVSHVSHQIKSDKRNVVNPQKEKKAPQKEL